MSANGDSTRDWLLKKLLKASKVLAEQEKELQSVKNELDFARHAGAELARVVQEQERKIITLDEKKDDLEFELQQVKLVPPIAPNLTVQFTDRRGHVENLAVQSVASAHGETLIRTRARS